MLQKRLVAKVRMCDTENLNLRRLSNEYTKVQQLFPCIPSNSPAHPRSCRKAIHLVEHCDQAAPDKVESGSAGCDGYNVVVAGVSMGIATNPYMVSFAMDYLSQSRSNEH
jgi:hypothetical protein